LDSCFLLPGHALVHCYRGDIAGHAYVAVGEEDASMGDLGGAVDSSGVLCSDHIDQKAE
jgi:hypothetical protein